MTVARMMERDTFEIRFKAGVPIGVHEFLYPLMQGYDSVCVQADVELGGSDQTFNNLVGRQLQENAGQRPQIVVIMPILVGLDGTEKMSKSKGNYIGVAESPKEMFGKVMSIPDSLMENYFTLLTQLPPEEVKALVDPARTHPRAAKATLGKRIVAQYHGPAAGEEASAEFDRIFREKQAPAEMPEVRVPAGGMGIVQMIVSCGFAKGTSEARRLIEQGAVSIDDRAISNIDEQITPRGGEVLRVGKRRFGKIVIG
jgi:tyrosyl-tRNA synthetase